MSAYIAAPTSNDPYSQYPNLRTVLAPQYAYLPPSEIEALMESQFGPGAAERYEEDMEGIFDDIGKGISSVARDVGRFTAKAAPVVANIGGGVIKGAAAGSALGPIGAIVGGVAGGVGQGLSSYAKGPARNIGNILGTVTNVAGQFSPTGRLGGSLGSAVSGLAGGGQGGATGAAINTLGGLLGGGGGGGGAAGALGSLLSGGRRGTLGALTSLFGGTGAGGQLLAALRNPDIIRGITAAGLGQLGARSIPVGSAQTMVPVGAFTNLISQLANQAATEAAALSDGTESTLNYMIDNTGEYVGDPASEQDRAARVWDLLNEAQAERVLGAIYQGELESSDEAASCPHCGVYREDIYDAAELEELYDLSLEVDVGEEYREDFEEDFPEDYNNEWNEGFL
jgi:hypothetical protein